LPTTEAERDELEDSFVAMARIFCISGLNPTAPDAGIRRDAEVEDAARGDAENP
jgi:hypothetical protein